jgi:hypothetical protein
MMQGYGKHMKTIDKVLATRNLTEACAEVVKNKGAAGTDRMGVKQLKAYLDINRKKLTAEILSGNYIPQPIRGKEIPKRNGKKRLLGIPTVVDRMLQQAVSRVLMPQYEYMFSDYSFGFRPQRNTLQAVQKSLGHINSGYQHIVDIDLKGFFDEVNHCLLLNLLYRKIQCPITLQLIRRWLRAPIWVNGKLVKRRKGLPQGSPITPRTQLQTLNLYGELLLNGVNSKFVYFTNSIIFVINGKITEVGISKTDQPGLCFIKQRQNTARGSRVFNEKVWSIPDTGVSLCSAGQGAHRKDANTGKFSGVYREIVLQTNQTGKGISMGPGPNHQQCNKVSAGGIFVEAGQWQKRSNNLRYPLSTTDYGSRNSHRHIISLFQQIKLLPTRKISLKLN